MMLSGASVSHELTETPKNVVDQVRSPDDAEGSRDGSNDSSAVKRKYEDRDPESPAQIDTEAAFAPEPTTKKERGYYENIGTDSPSTFPKHVIVPNSDRHSEDPLPHSPDEQRLNQPTFTSPEKGAPVLTPDSINRPRPSQSYDSAQPPAYRQQSYHDVYRTPSYNAEMDYRGSYGPPNSAPAASGENFVRPRRCWACDFCKVATFLSYEEACAHEEACSRRFEPHQYPPRPPPPHYRGPPVPPQGSAGLGALYHASQEVVTPPTPHRHSSNRWGNHGPPLPVFPHEQNYYRPGPYDVREEPVPYHDLYSYHQPSHYPTSHHPHHPPQDYFQKRLTLAMPSDRDSLSDRQCYVRAEMVEIFAANEKDVSARHSKGAQKLVMGQVGIRCLFCCHLRPRDRAERAVCYPSSISRIYQTVADMQRFHFEQCREIPDHVRQLYKKLKTTRPRGVGSPQTYWMSSAKSLGLVDTADGIRFESDLIKDSQQQPQQPPQQSHVSDMSTGTI